MNDLRFTSDELKLLSELLNPSESSIIWDINAFYFNIAKSTYKLECFDASPDGSNYQYDEIFFCRFTKLSNQIQFEEDNEKYWYKIFSKSISISSFDIIDIIQVYPSQTIIDKNALKQYINGINRMTLGVVINTPLGSIPAFLLPSNHGFAWHPKFDFYSKGEIEEILKSDIKNYEIRSIR
jgi:hypothetical protein